MVLRMSRWRSAIEASPSRTASQDVCLPTTTCEDPAASTSRDARSVSCHPVEAIPRAGQRRPLALEVERRGIDGREIQPPRRRRRLGPEVARDPGGRVARGIGPSGGWGELISWPIMQAACVRQLCGKSRRAQGRRLQLEQPAAPERSVVEAALAGASVGAIMTHGRPPARSTFQGQDGVPPALFSVLRSPNPPSAGVSRGLREDPRPRPGRETALDVIRSSQESPRLVDENGRRLTLRGTNLGGWLLWEGSIWGAKLHVLSTWGHAPRERHRGAPRRRRGHRRALPLS